MADLFRILAAFLALYMQRITPGAPKLQPIVRPPTATATRTATFTPTPTATFTIPPTKPPTQPPPTATAKPAVSSADPVGFAVVGVPPAQKLPAAFLVYPLVRSLTTSDRTIDTTIELMNLSSTLVTLQCFYVQGTTCNEIGFWVTLTGQQPIAWKARTGVGGTGRRVAPPFTGDGELKCAVVPNTSDVSSYNTVQGRAIVSDAPTQPVASDTAAQTVGYSAIAFRRLSSGDFTGEIALDGITYEMCPDRLHFQVLANKGDFDSELILVPCAQDLERQLPSGANIQLAVINEFENRLSGATSVKCFNRISFGTLPSLRRTSVGTDTAHLIVYGTDVPVVGLVIDRFKVPDTGAPSTSSNEPYLEGGRPAIVQLP